ncbi:hypothetical protein Pla110_26020 [Polystyrenella longa]|uniref:Uncharacterized protein n=1 Tax=Polystyrenella longa TaxID=2528007 RepID=A0A518CNQ5_9PLAN|nr:unc-93 family MFS transporter [Polystyrenella longa]QDU80866.1 hypothetical protein Pla110_26020 [Polystyrenella longa]
MAFLIVGIVVALLGLGLVITHIRVWQRESAVPNVDKTELRSQRWQYRRRVTTSSLMAVVGGLIVLGQSIDRQAHPAIYICIWMVVIVIAMAMILLALIDFTVVRRRLKTRLVVLEAKKKMLEKEARLLRQQQDGNHELN